MKNKNKKINTTNNNSAKKLDKAIKDLPMQQYMAVLNFIQEETNRITKEKERYYDEMAAALDRNFTAAMVLKTDYSLTEINEIFKLTFELIKDDNKKVLEFKREGNGDWMKAADKYVEKVVIRALELIKDKVNQKNAIETLVSEFPKVSKSMVTNAYKKAKELYTEELKLKQQVQADLEAEELYDVIFGKENIKDNEEGQENMDKKIDNGKETNLKVLNKKIIMDVQGEFGIYHIEDNNVSIDEVKFSSKEQVEETYKEQIEHITRCKNEALKVYEIINS